MSDARRIGLDEVVRHFEELEGPRCSINRKHPLASIVVIAAMVVLAGTGGPTAIARWAALKEEFLVGGPRLARGGPGQGCLPSRPDDPAPGSLPDLLRDLAGFAPRRGGRGHRRGAAHPRGRWQDGTAEPRPQERPSSQTTVLEVSRAMAAS
jgi:DDE_Tnp_1-associated